LIDFQKSILSRGELESTTFLSQLYFVLEATFRTETISSITLSAVSYFLKYGN
jgi:hypothetical protein